MDKKIVLTFYELSKQPGVFHRNRAGKDPLSEAAGDILQTLTRKEIAELPDTVRPVMVEFGAEPGQAKFTHLNMPAPAPRPTDKAAEDRALQRILHNLLAAAKEKSKKDTSFFDFIRGKKGNLQ